MNLKSIKYELQTILSGKSGNSYDALIQTIAHYLRTSQKTSPMAEEKHQNKAKETEKLITFAIENNLFYYFFADTSYQLLGFYENEKVLYAVVKQPFVQADSLTDWASPI